MEIKNNIADNLYSLNTLSRNLERSIECLGLENDRLIIEDVSNNAYALIYFIDNLIKNQLSNKD